MARGSSVNFIIGSFLERLDEIVVRCTDAIWSAIPAYERAGDTVKDDLRASVRDNVATLSEVLSNGRAVSRDELERIERVGARRAEGGIPLDDVLHAYRTVSRCCWDILAEECKRYEGDALDATILIAEAVLRYTDEISTSAAKAYARAQRTIVRQQEGARREFLADVLYGTDSPPDDILRRAHTFGYDLSLSYLAMVGQSPNAEVRSEAAVSTAAGNAVLDASADPIVLQRAEHTIALLPADSSLDPGVVPEKVTGELGAGWRFGIGGPEPGLEGIRRAYLEAREALEIGIALHIDGPVFRFDELLLYHFLRVEPGLIDRFVEQMLGPLIAHDERRKSELIKTLECYFDSDGSVKLAGEALFAHPHTISYRLKQVQKLSGWSLRNPEDKLRLQLGLRAHRLAQARRDETS